MTYVPENDYAFEWESFKRNTKNHITTLIKEDGVYRHLRFGDKSGSRMWSMDVVTWPDNLVTSGDIGQGFPFARTEDMLGFFANTSRSKKSDGSPWIDFRYWAEKITNHTTRQSTNVHDEELFIDTVRDLLNDNEKYGTDAITDYCNKIALLKHVYQSIGKDLSIQLEQYRYGKISARNLWQPDGVDTYDILQGNELYRQNLDLEWVINEDIEHDPQIKIDEIVEEARDYAQSPEEAYRFLRENEEYFGSDGYECSFTKYDSSFIYACYALDRIANDYVTGNIVIAESH